MLHQIIACCKVFLSVLIPAKAQKKPTKFSKYPHDTRSIAEGIKAANSNKLTLALQYYLQYCSSHVGENHCTTAIQLRTLLENKGIIFTQGTNK